MADKKFDESNSGIIGKNDYKQKDNHPDQRGRALIGGLWYWISGWDKHASGRDFTSLAFTEMTQDDVDKMMAKREGKKQPQQRQQTQQQQQPQNQPAPSQEPPMDFDDDIPF